MKLKTPAGLAKAIDAMKKDPEKFNRAFLEIRKRRRDGKDGGPSANPDDK